MRALHEDALICDFAEYYNVLDINALDIRMAAVLACGLPTGSRIIKELRGDQPDPELIYKYAVLDAIRDVEWAIWQTHSRKKLKRPERLVNKLLNKNSENYQEVRGFRTPEEFEAAWNS